MDSKRRFGLEERKSGGKAAFFRKNSMENSLSWLSQRIPPGCDPRGAGNCCTTPGKGGKGRESRPGIPTRKFPIWAHKSPKKKPKKGKRRKFPFFPRKSRIYLGWTGALGGGHEESVLGCSRGAGGDILRGQSGKIPEFQLQSQPDDPTAHPPAS